MTLTDTDHREKIISERAAALDFDTFKSVLGYLPSELRTRIVNLNSLERLTNHDKTQKTNKWTVFHEETEEDEQPLRQVPLKIDAMESHHDAVSFHKS
jgi:hypothetical protein